MSPAVSGNRAPCPSAGLRRVANIPLNTRQNGRHIICRTPPVLQDIQAELSGAVDIWMEHLTYEFDPRGLVGILFLKMHHEAKSAIFKGCVCRPNNYGIPEAIRQEIPNESLAWVLHTKS